MNHKGKIFAFTLAETLITIGIIGVVSALTIPSLMSSYRKHTIETRLKHSYALLNQVVKMAQVDNGEISGWDMESDMNTFVETYFLPYMKSEIKKIERRGVISYIAYIRLINGTEWKIIKYSVSPPGGKRYFHGKIQVDINGSQKPNQQGIDRFNFYIFPDKSTVYNTGDGDCARNVPSEGVYYDGYGFINRALRNAAYRGCGGATQEVGKNSFCIALIVKNNWKIPKNYPLKI